MDGSCQAPLNQTIQATIKRFTDKKADEVSAKSHNAIVNQLKYFVNFNQARGVEAVGDITDNHLDAYRSLLLIQQNRDGVPISTVRRRLQRVVEYMELCFTVNLLKELPRHIITKSLSIKKVDDYEGMPFTNDQLKAIWESCRDDRERLYNCLAINCAMLNADRGDLLLAEVDLKNGYFTRRRSKIRTTQGKAGIQVSYKLWPITARLLGNELAADHSYPLAVDEDGNKLAVLDDDGKPVAWRWEPERTPKEHDVIEPVFKRILKEMKINDKSFKSFRDTGTSLLFDSEYATYEDVYLSHKGANVSAIHYRAHPKARSRWH
jgi:integrase